MQDSGIGIPAAQLPRIFDRFYRVEQAPAKIPGQLRSSHTEGTGIGLSLVKELVELHRGTIQVESTEGEGTTFVVTLPIPASVPESLKMQPQEGADIVGSESGPSGEKSLPDFEEASGSSGTAPPLSHTPPVSTKKKMTQLDATVILIADDNPDFRYYLREILQEHYVVIEAANGREAIRRAAETVPDLIVSDVMMPEMDGYELCRAIRSDPVTSHIPILLLTAKAGEEDRLEGLHAGAVGYQIKPFRPVDLLARIKTQIDLQRRLLQKLHKHRLESDDPGIPGPGGRLSAAGEDLPSNEAAFLTQVEQIIETNLDDETFTVNILCKEIGMSRTQLHRKLRVLTSLPASRFIRIYKLRRAAALLRQAADTESGFGATVSEIAYQTGFRSPNYFSRCFREEFGYPPSEYQNRSS